MQTIQFELDKKGGKIKSEAGMMNKHESAIMPLEPREFIIDDTFTLFLKEKDKELPYFATKISDISSVQSGVRKKENNSISNENYKKYSKTIENVKLQLDIPNEWKYEEMSENDFYKYALKLYKNNEEQYAMLYFYNSQFGVCGTGRTAENIILNNGKEATIGYYDGNKNWSDISFYNINKNVAVMNYGLINTDANEVIEFIKTINIIEDNSENNNHIPENVTIEINSNTINSESVSITIADNNENHYGWVYSLEYNKMLMESVKI